MQSTIRRLFWCEAALATAAAATFTLTLLWSHWIELAFGLDPDHGSGSAEWTIVVASGVAAVMSSALTRYAWQLRGRRCLLATAQLEG